MESSEVFSSNFFFFRKRDLANHCSKGNLLH